MSKEEIDRFVPDTDVADQFGVTAMTLWRWDQDPKMIGLGWPPKVFFAKKNHRSQNLLEAFKQNLIKAALAERSAKAAAA